MARRKIRIDERQRNRRLFDLRKERRLKLKTKIKREIEETIRRARWSRYASSRYYATKIRVWTMKHLIELLPDEFKEDAIRFALMDLREARDVWEWLEAIFAKTFERGYFHYRLIHDIEERVKWKVYETFYSQPRFKVIVYFNAYSDCIRDRFFWETFRDYSEYAIYNVIKMVVGKIERCPTENVPDPFQKLFIEYFVPYFKRKMCRSGMLAMKITPITIQFIRGRKGSYYVSRYVPVFILRADVWATRTVPVDRHFKVLAWKKWITEYVSTRVYGGTDIVQLENVIVTGRDYLRDVYRLRRLRDVIYRPYTVIHDFARTIGRPEAWIDIDHCSVYVIPQRIPRTARVYQRLSKADKLLRYWSVIQGHGSTRFKY